MNRTRSPQERRAMFARLNERLAAQGLHHGKMSKTSIHPSSPYIQDEAWQSFRKSLKGTPTETKLKKLRSWLKKNKNSEASQVQVTNYINALKRGGQLKP